MGPNLLIAIRFLLAKKRSMLMSLGGIAFGVGFFIVTQAQVSGFKEMFIETILGTEGAIRITDRYQDSLVAVQTGIEGGAVSSFFIADKGNRRYVEGVEYPDDLMRAISTLTNVKGSSAVLKGGVWLESPLREESGEVYGIELDAHLAVTNLEEQIVFGSVSDFRATPTGVMIGLKLARRLQTSVGDSLIIIAEGQRNRYRVSALYETGVSEIDNNRIFMHMSSARSLLKEPHGVSFVQVSVADRAKAPLDALSIVRLTNHAATSWQERERSWLGVFRALSISAGITVSTIILISGLGMFNTLVMIVMEKTREIAILRSMGYTRGDISRVFFMQGAIVLLVGTLAGFGLGALITYAISHVHIGIRGIFTADTYVVNWSIAHYVYAAITATIIVMFASLAPARRAARLVPGEVIRGTSG